MSKNKAPPRNKVEIAPNSSVVHNVSNLLPGLSNAEGRIGALLLEDPVMFSGKNVRAIASDLSISEPTVVRFCRNVGYDGFKDLKYQLVQQIAVEQAQFDAAASGEYPFEVPAGGSKDSSQLCHHGALSAISNVYKTLDLEEIQRAATTISSANRIQIFGLGGSSAAMAMELHNRLFRLGINSVPSSDSYLQRMSAATLDENDVAIFLSATGRPQALLDCVELAKYYKAKCVGILPRDSVLAREVDICVHIELSQHGVHPFQPNPMRYAQLFAIDVLAFKVAETLGPKAESYLNRTRASVALLNGVTAQQPIGD